VKLGIFMAENLHDSVYYCQ